MADRLVARGQQFVQPDGTTLVLRGMNEGTWNTMVEADAALMKSWGVTVCRVLLRWWGVYSDPSIDCRDDSQPGNIKADHLARFKLELSWLRAQGIWPVITFDSDCGQSGTQDVATSTYGEDPVLWPYSPLYPGPWPDGRNFFTDPSQAAKFQTMQQYVLSDPDISGGAIGFIELLPEPLQGRDKTWSARLLSFYRTCITNVRTVEPGGVFIVGGRGAYTCGYVKEVYMSERDDVAYTGNLFVYTNSDQASNIASIASRGDNLVSLRDQQNVPIFVQQCGVKSGDDPTLVYQDALLNYLDANNLSGTIWQIRQNTSSSTQYAYIYQNPVGTADILKAPQIARAKIWFNAAQPTPPSPGKTTSGAPLLELMAMVCNEIGILEPSTVIGNTDLQVKQLLALMTREAREQSKMETPVGGWQAMREEYVFSTAAGTDTYSLPADYDHSTPGTFWDRSARWQLLGPMSPQEWQVIKSGISPTGPRRRFRFIGDSFVVDPVPSAVSTLVFEYTSTYWALTADGTPLPSFVADSDFFRLDDDALVLGTIWRFRRAKGLDYDEEKSSWQDRIDLVKARQAGERLLPMNAQPLRNGMLLSNANVPDTGFGS